MLTFHDGFDSYAATADVLRRWRAVPSPWTWGTGADQNGATNGIMTASTTGAALMLTPMETWTTQTVLMGFWLKVSAAPASIAALIYFLDGGNGACGTVQITTGGLLTLYTRTGVLMFTGSTNVCDNTWHWVELHFQSSSGAGFERCTVDVTSQWSSSAASPASGNIVRMAAFISIAGQTVSISDVICWDDTPGGPTTASYPIGARKITTRRPSADSVVQFARSSGSTNYSLVNEVNADTSNYVEGGSPALQDLYDYDDLGFTPSSITAVSLVTTLANPNAGAVMVQGVVKSGSVTDTGFAIVAPATIGTRAHPLYVDPSTGLAWTESGFNAAKFGPKVGPALPGYRYLRLYITAPISGNICYVGEWQAFDGATGFGSNLIVAGGSILAGSTYGGGNTAAMAIDSVYSTTSWAPPNSSPPWWLRYDFAAEKRITGVTLIMNLVRDFTLQCSVDGNNWFDLWSQAGEPTWDANGYGMRRYRIPTASAYLGSPHGTHAHWRVRLLVGNVAGGVVLAEMEMRATPGGADQCAGGTAIAGVPNGSFPATNAFDNNNSTLFATTAQGITAYIGYSFAAPVAVAEIMVTARGDTSITTSPNTMHVEFAESASGPWTHAWAIPVQTGWVLGETRVFTDPNYMYASMLADSTGTRADTTLYTADKV